MNVEEREPTLVAMLRVTWGTVLKSRRDCNKLPSYLLVELGKAKIVGLLEITAGRDF